MKSSRKATHQSSWCSRNLEIFREIVDKDISAMATMLVGRHRRHKCALKIQLPIDEQSACQLSTRPLGASLATSESLVYLVRGRPSKATPCFQTKHVLELQWVCAQDVVLVWPKVAVHRVSVLFRVIKDGLPKYQVAAQALW